jgi:hypothetical protein
MLSKRSPNGGVMCTALNTLISQYLSSYCTTSIEGWMALGSLQESFSLSFFLSIFLSFFLSFCFVFFFSVSLCSFSCPGTLSVDQASLDLRDWPVSASRVLGIKMCAPSVIL